MTQHLTHIAAIDAGSNGIRLIVGGVDASGALHELESTREAVRLGADAFSTGVLSDHTMDAAAAAFQRFRQTMALYEVAHYRAVATSASRDAANGQALVDRIYQATGIDLEIIDGIEEAQLAFRGMTMTADLAGKTALLIDIGGGSLELTATVNGRAMGCESLPIGPVRFLERLRAEGAAEKDAPRYLEEYAGSVTNLMKAEFKGKSPDVCLGAGGNVVRMAKLRLQLLGKVKPGKIKLADLDKLIEQMLPMSQADRMSKLGLRQDRADVIVLAMMVMRQAIGEAGVRRVLVPGTGLKEGLLRSVADRVRPLRKKTAPVDAPAQP